MTTHKTSCFLLALLCIAGSAIHAHAQLLNGHSLEVQLQPHFPGQPIVVDSMPGAVEILNLSTIGFLSVDVFDTDPSHSSILITFLTVGTFGASQALVFKNFTPRLPPFTTVAVGAYSWPGFTPSLLTNTIDSITLRVGDGPLTHPGDFVRIDLSDRPPPEVVGRVTLDVSEVRLCWYGHTNKTYQVQYRSSLTTNSWVDLGGTVQGTGGTNCVTDAVGSPKRFYQVLSFP